MSHLRLSQPPDVTPPGRCGMSGKHSALLAFAEDVHRELGLSLITARRWISRGKFGPHIKVGKRIAVRREALEAYVRARFAEAHEGR